MPETPHHLMKIIWNRDGLSQIHQALYDRPGTSYHLDQLITRILDAVWDDSSRQAVRNHVDRTLRQLGDDREAMVHTAGRVRPSYQDAALHRLALQEARLNRLKKALQL